MANRNITYIPGPISTMPTTAHATPGVAFLGNEMYSPLHQPASPYEDASLGAPGIPVLGIMMQTASQRVPVISYPSDIGAPAADIACITR